MNIKSEIMLSFEPRVGMTTIKGLKIQHDTNVIVDQVRDLTSLGK